MDSIETDFGLNYGSSGLIPTVVQHFRTNEVLMVAYSNEESVALSQQTGIAHFYSRSRQSLWKKGETSGNYLNIVYVFTDCDKDTLLYVVDPDGPACHTGANSCFFVALYGNEDFLGSDPAMLQKVYDIVRDRMENPVEGSYTNYLFSSGIDKILKKIGEESAETIIASKNNSREEIIFETSDLLYHLMVMLNDRGVELDEILGCLKSRHAASVRPSD
ncbi:MAG: bifunctional phosphoribosyl-AMP cyclohydrolase/phosphoribosyl-ATP diphosphatase HisIE [Eubacteriaceae bacterium]|jgi:phosphoribosyl-ATP pyrophosphohydrolase/phosphoribosyl-AMP cyclohydrolase|nr:bifunctional phosphoribosyl-AMP cyclohydrolase/phosphoribosyl-ATP diphosphatase HisIE [Eubacteriaceae bacterium]